MSRLGRYIALILALFPVFAAGAQDDPPGWQSADCPPAWLAQAGAGATDIRCGWLRRPENREAPDAGRLVELFVARIASRLPTDGAPILHLAGGPGDAASAELEFWLESPLLDDHDIILLDQRGTGFSRPSLDCPEAEVAQDAAWIPACRERLQAQGIDLAQYHTMATVFDFRDLLAALEIERVNLYGKSFGSRLALLLADIAPDRVRSMTLDGVYPPPLHDMDAIAVNAQRALERLFSDCAADEACAAIFPDLPATFYRVVAEMNESPPELTNMGEGAGITMNGDQFLAWTVGMLRYRDALPALPSLIAIFGEGMYDFLLLLDAFVKAPYWNDGDARSEGAELSIRCAEALTLARMERARDDELAVAEAFARVLDPVARQQRDQCAQWKAAPAPEAIASAVASDLPTLLLSGAYDPATPPHWAEYAAGQLRAGWHFVFPDVGHGVLQSHECAFQLTRVFLASPLREPAADCLNDLEPPRFADEERSAK